jgi:hypothetical protein
MILLSLTTIHTLYNKIVSDKHKDLVAHFACAALSQGFIDAGEGLDSCLGRPIFISVIVCPHC